MSEAELPEVHEALLDVDTLQRLREDLTQAATLLDVSIKLGAELHADHARPSLDEALALLVAGRVRGVQVRYLHGGVEWWDTLLGTPKGVRLVRVRAPVVNPP